MHRFFSSSSIEAALTASMEKNVKRRGAVGRFVMLDLRGVREGTSAMSLSHDK